jgi:hypothetical protein
MKNWIVNNFWIKVISLALAIATWFIVHGELEKERRFSRRFYNSALYKSYLAEDSKENPSSKKTDMNKGYITEKK